MLKNDIEIFIACSLPRDVYFSLNLAPLAEKKAFAPPLGKKPKSAPDNNYFQYFYHKYKFTNFCQKVILSIYLLNGSYNGSYINPLHVAIDIFYSHKFSYIIATYKDIVICSDVATDV